MLTINLTPVCHSAVLAVINYILDSEEEDFDTHCLENGFTPQVHVYHEALVACIGITGSVDYNGVTFTDVDNLNQAIEWIYVDDEEHVMVCPLCGREHVRDGWDAEDIASLATGVGCFDDDGVYCCPEDVNDIK